MRQITRKYAQLNRQYEAIHAIVHLTKKGLLVLACFAAICVAPPGVFAQQKNQQNSSAAVSTTIKFEQPRLRLSLVLPAQAVATRTEQPTYDEVKVELPNKGGELFLWTYSRKFHSGADMLITQMNAEFQDAHISAKKLGTLPALFLRRKSDTKAPFVTRSIIDRPGFDWVYVLEAEANTVKARQTLLAIIDSIAPL